MDDIEIQHSDMVSRLSKPGADILASLDASKVDIWHHATGASTETGELLTAVKALVVYGRLIDRDNVVEEMGDLEFFMQGLRNAIGISREETLRHNINKLAKRYPGYRYSDAAGIARLDKEI